ncbi:MAG: hypothetical protein G01um101419_771 [Parcubacteria group bacterium Gr01-1014_19]|nr:MAG: hypothetical protein G01um101419_771 [Parcubacteria group bacterium Gr01-1014_19]
MFIMRLRITLFLFLLTPLITLAALPVPESIITPGNLKEKYKKDKITVLVIPGHINSLRTGASFRGINERELTKQAADKLVELLRLDPKFSVFTFTDVEPYFQYPDKIKEFRREAYQNSRALSDKGIVSKNQTVQHVSIPNDDSLILYGINKWARDHNIDIVIHLHFNDYPRPYRRLPGEYTGFAIYIPERQLFNHHSSAAVAEAVAGRLKDYFPVSDYPPESAGLVEDQDLIAVGSPSAFYGAALLIEYGYLYEVQYIDPELRPLAIQELTHQTYLGLKNFFDPEFSKTFRATANLPSQWTKYLRHGFRGDSDVYSLQLALLDQGFYPPFSPEGLRRSKNDCPINGNFGGCTRKALIEFQKNNGIEPTGFAGPATLKRLNELYRTN